MDGGCYNARSLAALASIVEVREIYIRIRIRIVMKGEISRTCVIKTVEEDDKWRDTLKTSVDNDIDTTVSYEHGL
jgi:hypothetical protein